MVQKSGAVEMRGAVEERVRAGPRREETRAHHGSKIGCGRDAWSGGGACPSWSAARRDPGASQFKNRVRSRCVERWRSVSELVPRREETRAHHSSKIGCGRDAWSGGGACPSWSRGAKRPGRITVQKSGAVEMRGAVEERV